MKYVTVVVAILFLALTACKGPALPTPSPVDSGLSVPVPTGGSLTRLDDQPLCGPAAPETPLPWRQYWRSPYTQGGVSALLKDGDWLWVGTSQGLARLNLQTLACTLLEYTDTDPVVSLYEIYTLLQDPKGCLWAASREGVARYCADASGEGAGWQPVPLEYYPFRLAFDADGNLWTYTPGGRGLPPVFRFDGHEPPSGEMWQGERISYQDMPAEDCANWFAKSYSEGDRDRFQSPQECRELAAWRERLAALLLPAGLEPLEFFAPLAAGGENVWLFAQWSRPTAEHPERYALLRFTDKGVDGGDWLVVPWPLATLGPGIFMVADEGRAGVWIGSLDGLAFSDGHTLQRVLLTSGDLMPVGSIVSGLARDKAGRLWAATDQGLFRFDEAADRWEATEIIDVVLITPDDRGGLWAVSRSSEGQVSHFDGECWEHHPKPGGWPCWPTDIAADVGGGLWLTSPACELQGFDGRQWAPYGGGFDIQGALLARGPDGELYTALRDDRIQRYDGSAWEILPAPERHRYTPVSAMTADLRGGLWVGYHSSPYLRYFDGSQWHEFSGSGSVPAYALLIDARGDLWVGGEQQTLLHYDGGNWERIPTSDLIFDLAEDRGGRIWAGGLHGLYVYEPAGSGK